MPRQASPLLSNPPLYVPPRPALLVSPLTSPNLALREARVPPWLQPLTRCPAGPSHPHWPHTLAPYTGPIHWPHTLAPYIGLLIRQVILLLGGPFLMLVGGLMYRYNDVPLPWLLRSPHPLPPHHLSCVPMCAAAPMWSGASCPHASLTSPQPCRDHATRPARRVMPLAGHSSGRRGACDAARRAGDRPLRSCTPKSRRRPLQCRRPQPYRACDGDTEAAGPAALGSAGADTEAAGPRA